MKVNKLKHQPDYKGVTILVIDALIKTVTDKEGNDVGNYELLNAFEWEKDLVPTLPDFLKKQVRGECKMKLKYDNISGGLSIATNYITSHNMTEEDIVKLAKWSKHEWATELGAKLSNLSADQKILIPFTLKDEEEIFINVSWDDIEAVMLPNYLPKGKMWLATIFDDLTDQMMYEEFMIDDIIFGRLKNLCIKKGATLKPGVAISAQLPVHSIDEVSKEIVVSDTVISIFNQYKFCRNYLNHDKGTTEHDLGKLMMLYPKLCEYIMSVAERAVEGKPVNPENYQTQVNKAIKYVMKKPELMELYENNLVVPDIE